MSKIGRFRDKSRTFAELSRWRQVRAVLGSVGRDRCQQKGSALVKKRVSSHVQPSSTVCSGKPSTDPRLSPIVVDNLPRSSQERCVKGHGPTVASKTVHTGHGRNGNRVLLKSVPRGQAVRRLAVSHRPFGTQRVPSTENIRDGHVGEGQESSTSGHVGILARSLRCVPPYTDKAIRSEVSMLSSGRSKVHVHGPTIWIDDSPVGVHEGSQADKKVDYPSPIRAVSIHRRLAQCPHEQDGAAPQDGSVGAALSTARITGEREEIRASSLAVDRILRRTSGSSGGQSVPDPGKSGRDPHRDPADPGGRRSILPKCGISVRHVGIDITDGAVGTAESQTPSATSDSEDKEGPSQHAADPGIGSVGAIPEVVGVRGGPTDRIRFPSARSGAHDLHRRVVGRLGSLIPRPIVARKVAAHGSAYQLVGAEDGADGHPAPAVSNQGPVRVSTSGQHDSSGLSQEPRRDQIQGPVEVIEKDSTTSSQSPGDTRSPPYHGPAQRASGLGLKSGSSNSVGVGPDPRSIQLGDRAVPLGSAGGGRVCKRQQSQTRDVHVTVPGRKSNRRGRPALSLAGKDSVRLPSDVHSTSRTQQNAIGSPVQDPPGPVLVATRQLDPDVELASAPLRTSVSSHADVGEATALGSRASGSASVEPSAVVSREDKMRQMGFSEKVICRLDKARASSTRKHYKSQWDLFESWAVKNGLNPLDAGLPLLTQFLEYLFTVRKVGLRTIKNYRSAIAHYWKSSVGYEIPEADPVLKDLFRGFAREKPIPRKLVVDWDVCLVLQFLKSDKFENWDQVSDRWLTLKTTFLLALATGRRRSELHALTRNVSWVNGESREVQLSIHPDFVGKTHLTSKGPGSFRSVSVKALQEADGQDLLLCPVRTLEAYLDRSKHYRSPDQHKLIIPYRRGSVKDLSKQTLSNYIKETVVLAYQEQNPDSEYVRSLKIKPHSIRHVATSLNALRAVDMDDVLQAGTWASPNVFLKHYVQYFSTDHLSQLSRLGGFVAAGSVI